MSLVQFRARNQTRDLWIADECSTTELTLPVILGCSHLGAIDGAIYVALLKVRNGNATASNLRNRNVLCYYLPKPAVACHSDVSRGKKVVMFTNQVFK